MLADRTWIEEHIPHQGTMCLLASVECCSDDEATCLSHAHLDLCNPLRDGDDLGMSVAIEIAAQAMAVHGVLSQSNTTRPKRGYLTSVRQVKWSPAGWPNGDVVRVKVWRESGVGDTVLYGFELSDMVRQEVFVTGRATVLLDSAAWASGRSLMG